MLVVTESEGAGAARSLPTGDLPSYLTPCGAVWRVDAAPGGGQGCLVRSVGTGPAPARGSLRTCL